jgi:hypothetical protein
MNKTKLYIQLPETSVTQQRFGDTYLALGPFGPTNLQLGLEFPVDVTGIFNVGDNIFIDKDDKSINPWADGPATILGFTFSTIYPAPATLVFTSIPLQLPISFTSGEAGALYLGTSIQSGWTEVDLSDNVAFPITFNIADVREINNRNGAYSKTIQIPGTKTNNDVFKYIFDIQGVDNYDTRVKVKCNVVVDTIPVLEGYIQLNSISAKDNRHWTYECTIFGENANFSKEIDQNARLEDLDFSDLDHDFNITSVTQSWIGEYTDGYYYPLIDFNTGQKPGERKIGNRTEGFQIENFRGSIYAKQYLDRILDSYGYKYESEFLNSEAFNTLIIPPTKKILESSADWRFNSTFRAGLTQSISYSTLYGYEYVSGFTSPNDAVVIIGYPIINNPVTTNMSSLLQFDDTTPPNGDPGSNFIQVPLGEFYYKNVFENTYNKQQKIVLNLDFDLSATLFNGNPVTLSRLNGIRLLMFCDIYKNGTLISRKPVLNYGNTTSDYWWFDFSFQIGLSGAYTSPEDWSLDLLGRRTIQIVADTAGGLVTGPNDEIRFKLGMVTTRSLTDPSLSLTVLRDTQQFNWLNTKFNVQFYPTTNGQDGTYFFNELYPELNNNQPVTASEFIPRNIKQIDYINSIINMFNLYLYQDKIDPKKIYIEPRDRFYDTSQFLNWSDKLDIDKEITQTPVVERYKRITLNYKDDNDFYNKNYKSLTNETYGQFEYLTGDEVSNSEKKITLIFSPTPLNMWSLNDQIYDSSFIYSRVFDQKQPITDETKFKVDSNIRILYRKTIPVLSNTLYIYAGGTNYSFNNYPYAGHLDDPTDAGLDLSFDAPKLLFYDNEFSYTTNNLYNEYYDQFFEEIYGPESKVITAYVYLNSQDILDFDYRKLIYIDNISSGSPGYFRINKIEYDPSNKQSYKVELIKVLNNFKSKYRRIISLGDVGVALPGSGNGLVTAGGNVNNGGNNVIGGIGNISDGRNNFISGGGNSVVSDNNVVSGSDNSVQGRNNSIIGGRLNNISGSDSSIIAGASNSIIGERSIVVGGYDNKLTSYSSYSAIINGLSNTIGATSSTQSSVALNSFILGGSNNTIFAGITQSVTDNVFLLGGQNNIIAPGVTNSFIIGGENFTATQSNTIYLEASTISIDGNVFINGSAPSVVTPIPAREIAFGDGSGIISSSALKFDTSFNLIAGAPTNTLSTTSYSSMIGGSNNTNDNSFASSVIGGINNCIDDGIRSSIIGGLNNTIDTNSDATILGAQNSLIDGFSRYSAIIAGQCNELRDTATNTAIIAGYRNRICGVSIRSSIIGGSTNTIDDSRRSLILGGQNLTLTSEDDTVLVPNLIVDNNISFNNVAGTATITGGTSVVVNNTRVQAGSKILVTGDANTTFFVTAIVAGTSFTINAGTSGTYTISWLIIN